MTNIECFVGLTNRSFGLILGLVKYGLSN